MKNNTNNTELKVAVAEDIEALFAANELLNDEQAIVIVGGSKSKDITNKRKCITNNGCSYTAN